MCVSQTHKTPFPQEQATQSQNQNDILAHLFVCTRLGEVSIPHLLGPDRYVQVYPVCAAVDAVGIGQPCVAYHGLRREEVA